MYIGCCYYLLVGMLLYTGNALAKNLFPWASTCRLHELWIEKRNTALSWLTKT